MLAEHNLEEQVAGVSQKLEAAQAHFKADMGPEEQTWLGL